MLHRIPTLSKLFYFLALGIPILGQSSSTEPVVRHYGYSGMDQILQCIQQVYRKPAVGFPGLRVQIHPDFQCPNTREGVANLLETEIAPSFVTPKDQPFGVRLFEMPEWVYILPEMYVAENSRVPRYPASEKWKSIKIQTDVEVDSSISEPEAKLLVPVILHDARIIPLRPVAELAATQDEADLHIRLRFYKAKMGSNTPDSVITVIDQPSLLILGRIVYGEMRNGKYQLLWDSPLFNSRGNIYFYDVNADGLKEIVWRSAICGAQNCMPQQMVIFDRNGREITRQQKCPDAAESFYYFDQIDGVCPIEGNEIQFSVLSPYPNTPETLVPKDILVEDAGGKSVAFTLVDGVYTPSMLDAAALSKTRKVQAEHNAAALNERGMQLMKEGKYSAAADIFVKTSDTINGENASYMNNAGYAYYKAGNYRDSISWLGAAISLNPKNAVAYLNRGEAFVALHNASRGREDQKAYLVGYCIVNEEPCVAEARKDFVKYLELVPNSGKALEVKKKLEALPQTP